MYYGTDMKSNVVPICPPDAPVSACLVASCAEALHICSFLSIASHGNCLLLLFLKYLAMITRQGNTD
jgi:hypothetical protein